MNETDIKRIEALAKEIDALPSGYISKKRVGGGVYFYHQWSEKGAKHSRYLKEEELAELSAQIERRKQLQAELKAAKARLAGVKEWGLRCALMHRHAPVADLILDEDTGYIQKILSLTDEARLPVGVSVKNGCPDRKALNDWWTERSIPASRSGVREALETLGITDTKSLLIRCYGLSLSDQYWICPEGSGLKWEDINFFTNGFSDDIGDALFGAGKKADPLNFSSPDNTSDGNLKKRWKIINGKRRLIKGGSNPYRQQPLNEAIVTEIAERLGIDCVPYTVTWNKGAPYSVCGDFVTEDTELVPAWRIIQTRKKPNNVSLYRHFVTCGEKLGIPGVVSFLDRMIVLDYIIANEDRHLNNFGALRDAQTLSWLGMAPIYDSGSSFGYDKPPALMRRPGETVCKPFKQSHEEQLRLVSSFDWIDFSALSDAGEIIGRILSDPRAGDYIDTARINAIVSAAEDRISRLKLIAARGASPETASLEGDVTENTAAKY